MAAQPGEISVGVAKAMHARLYQDQMRYPKASAQLKEAISILGARSKDDDSQLIACKVQSADLMIDEGNPQPAEALLRECLPKMETKLGEDHPYVAGIRLKIARCLVAKNEFQRAEELF